MMAAHRRPDTGLIRPYRPLPEDFRERFLEMGQSKELEEHYRTNWRVVRRWVEEAGGDELRRERFALAGARTGGSLHPSRRSTVAKLYVQGKRIRLARKRWPCPAPTFWDMGLVHADVARREVPRGPYKITIERAARLAMSVIVDGVSDDFRAGVLAAVAAIETAKAAA